MHAVSGLSQGDSEELLVELVYFARQPESIYNYEKTSGDAILSDNQILMHRACPWNMKEPRIMLLSRIAGDPETEGALANN